MNVDHSLLASMDCGPINSAHFPIVRSTFAHAVAETEPDPATARLALHRIIHRVLVDPRTVSVVAWPRGYSDEHIGWAVALGGALVFVYVKYRFRRKGIGTMLAARVLDPDGPIRVAYWTRAAGRMALGGYPIVHDMAAQSEIARLAR